MHFKHAILLGFVLRGFPVHSWVQGGDSVKSSTLVKLIEWHSAGRRVCRRLRALAMPDFWRREAGLTATAWSPCWGGICCVCSLLPAPPLLSWQAVVQGRQTASLSQDRCVLAALSAPSLGSPPPSPLTHPSRALSVECPVPAGIASLLSSLRLLVAAFALTKKGLRSGFHNCCGGICHLSYVWCVSGLEMPPAPCVFSQLKH